MYLNRTVNFPKECLDTFTLLYVRFHHDRQRDCVIGSRGSEALDGDSEVVEGQ